MEWFDPAAVGMPPGDISEDNRKKLWIPEIALQNTLKTGVEIHYPPEIIFSEKGHVAAKVLYQAMMQMEIDMRLFPFDTQRLNIVLGLRARRDRDRAVFCRFCHVDSQIRLDEWKLLGAFHHTDRPDGRARVQFGVVIGRGYMYYVLNVLMTLWAIASSSFAGYLLQMRPPFDRLRFCISILFAQTTFRLSIDSKLPIVSYATAFDHFAMACQLLLLSIILGDVIVVMLADRWFGFGGEEVAQTVGAERIIAILSFSLWVSRQRKKNASVLHLNQSGESHEKERAGTAVVRRQCRGLVWGDPEEKNLEDFSPEAIDQVGRLRGRLRYTSARRLSPTEEKLSSDAVAVSTYLWFIHDIDPIQAQYECKFTSYIEWICPNAVRLPAPTSELQEVLAELGVEDAEDMARHPCSAEGITCHEGRDIIGLAFIRRGLRGKLSSKLGQLKNLFFIDLFENHLTGPIPKELGELKSLNFLRLNDNLLTGEIPKELGALSRVEAIYLANNHLMGEIPQELGQLRDLQTLDLFGNQLIGSIPKELGQLKGLRVLDVSKNQLTGRIPQELGQLVELQKLFMQHNHLEGSIPRDLGNLKVLRTLALQQNELSGEIPVELSQLRLFQLSLAKNKLIGHIPKELGQISCLAELWLSQNQLSGEIPKELGDLANLTTLLLDRNQLTGPIPMQLSQLQALDWFNLDSNQLTGEIPRELGQLKAMRALTLRRNQLSGEIPKELGELPALTTLDLAMNQLKGPIPAELAQLKALRILFFDSNDLEGEIPPGLGGLPALSKLDLRKNHLTGPIPKELGGLQALTTLGLSENELEGVVPKELGHLASLRSLFISHNQLQGRLPKELGQLEQLQELFLAENQLSGELPKELGELKHLRTLVLYENQLSGRIPKELAQSEALEEIFLTKNRLEHEIPKELGQLKHLKYLQLGQNRLTGCIPREIGQLKALRILSLHENVLSGDLPIELGELTQLVRLLLHRNHLRGSTREISLVWNAKPVLEVLDLSHNAFTGSFQFMNGKLHESFRKLQYLDLSHNNFHGGLSELAGIFCHISPKGGSLQELRLNHNDFTGEVPSCLMQFRRLNFLALNNNRLSGALPEVTAPELVILALHKNELSGVLPQNLHMLRHLGVLTLHQNFIGGSISNLSLTGPCMDNARFRHGALSCSQLGFLYRLLPIFKVRKELSKQIDANCPTLNDGCITAHGTANLTLHRNRFSCEVPESISRVNVTGLVVMGNMLGLGSELNSSWILKEEKQSFLYYSHVVWRSNVSILAGRDPNLHVLLASGKPQAKTSELTCHCNPGPRIAKSNISHASRAKF
ncbi:unnamed protein product [Durusdinium trenchii]|uniref:Uncharacterized protein n=1 Tax=Durusdinium trenchii TaxID=1381693 RepID=A0ABP0J9D5_9DINO